MGASIPAAGPRVREFAYRPGMIARRLAVALALAALAAAGCSDDSVYSGGGGDPETRRAGRAVVRANLTALARGDARTFCGSYTPQFLRTYRDSYAKCVSDFGEPRPNAPAPRIVWGDFLTASDTKVGVEFRLAGSDTNQTYFLEYRRPVPQVGSTPRWLIDMETIERD